MEAYLGPERPRWSPKNETEVREAVAQGWIAESHHIDVKREIGDSRGDRRETARDLASFAIDGGALLIGVEEDKANRTFSLAPQPLDGLMEKLEQVAAFVVDPPLTIISEEIPSIDDSTSGYLLVHVPPSSSAPHMVGGQYFGRGERTRRQLSDAEILRLHARRRSARTRGRVSWTSRSNAIRSLRTQGSRVTSTWWPSPLARPTVLRTASSGAITMQFTISSCERRFLW